MLLKIREDLFCFFRNDSDSDPVRMMFSEAVQHTIVIITDMGGLESLPFPVLNLPESVQYFFLVGDKQKFVHPQTSIVRQFFLPYGLLYPFQPDYAIISGNFSCDLSIFLLVFSI